MDYLSFQNWSFPVPIRYGPGRIKELSRNLSNQRHQKTLSGYR